MENLINLIWVIAVVFVSIDVLACIADKRESKRIDNHDFNKKH